MTDQREEKKMSIRETALHCGAFEHGDITDSDYSIEFPSLMRLQEYTEACAAKQAEKIAELEAQYLSMSKSYADQWELREQQQAEIARLTAELAALKSQVETVRDAILSGRGSLESVLDSDQTNAVLNEFDVLFAAPPLREGWVSVPREPSEKMLQALAQEWHSDKYAYMVERYKVMIAASEEG